MNSLADNDFTILNKLDFDAPLIILNADEQMAKKWKKNIQSSLKIKDKIQQEIKDLPINCRICGDKLDMGGNAHGQSWHCDDHTGYDDNGRVYKKGRSLCDDHYEKSTIYMELDKFRMYEEMEKTLMRLLK